MPSATRSVSSAPADLDTQSGPALRKSVVAILKKNGGLHAQFIELLPPETTPAVLRAILDAIIDSGYNRLHGIHQL
jgi:hypothetical protein